MNNTPNTSNFFTHSPEKNDAAEAPILEQAANLNLRVRSLLEAGMDTTPEQFELCDLLEQAKYTESPDVVTKLEDMINELIDPTLDAVFEQDLDYLTEVAINDTLDFDHNPKHIAVADRMNSKNIKAPKNRNFDMAA